MQFINFFAMDVRERRDRVLDGRDLFVNAFEKIAPFNQTLWLFRRQQISTRVNFARQLLQADRVGALPRSRQLQDFLREVRSECHSTHQAGVDRKVCRREFRDMSA